MPTLVITTTGTSLLTNRDDRPWAGWHRGEPLPSAEKVQQWLGQLQDEDLVKASAELHTWYRLGVFDPDSDYKVALVHSQTDEGRFCANTLAKYAESRGIEAETCEVKSLRYTDSKEFNKGLSNLAKTLSSLIARRQQVGSVIMAATGGFKAEIAVANLVGALLGCAVYYIYEQFEELVCIDPLPVGFARNWVTQGPVCGLLENVFKEENDVVRPAEVRNYVLQEPRIDSLLEYDKDEVALNMLGITAKKLLQQSVPDWPRPSERNPEDKINLANAPHHRPRETEDVVRILADNPYTTLIRYDPEGGYARGIRPAEDNASDIIVVFGDDNRLRLLVSTTAKNAGQRELVLQSIRRHLRPYL